ncbi:MAG: hypothetical protein HUU23_08825 [Caldilineales bacterium]|nr:hypothetical protein [Caldilineales bacterium]
MGTDHAIDAYLAGLAERLELDAQQRRELLDEMRGHLQDAVAAAQARGLDEQTSLQEALAAFGPEVRIAAEMNTVYAGWGMTDAIIFTALPVIMGLLLRWLVFAPAGSAAGWEKVLTSLPFWIVALAALLVPLLRFPRFRFALISWVLFWSMTVAFVALG